jgi:NADPH:quinone reductase-like Zn-dependent oxidoreductase
MQGTLAEFVAADAALLAHKPKSLSMQQAAVMPLVTITAWEGLVDKARVQPGETALIHAGAGGVGYAAIQIALARGATVFATVSQEKRAIVEALGATAIGRYASVNDYLDEFAGGEGFDVVYDTLGGTVLDASFSAVKRYTGRVVSCLGWGTHSLAPLSFRSASYSGVFTLFPLLSGLQRAHQGAILSEATTLVEQKRLEPLLAATQFDGDSLEGAFDLVARGSNGKIAVQI